MSNPLSHKLYHFEQEPPAKIWDAVASSLDKPLFAERLANFEQLPPAPVWNNIEAQLNTKEPEAETIPFFKRFSVGAKYAAAAAVLIVLAAAITFFVNGGRKTEMAIQAPENKTEQTTKTVTNQKTPLPESDSGTEQKAVTQITTTPRQEPAQKVTSAKPARYITVADDEGKKVRLSKKAYTVFNCAENTAAANNERCKENIQLAQQKMAVSLSPSGDFGALIDMLKTLEENN